MWFLAMEAWADGSPWRLDFRQVDGPFPIQDRLIDTPWGWAGTAYWFVLVPPAGMSNH